MLNLNWLKTLKALKTAEKSLALAKADATEKLRLLLKLRQPLKLLSLNNQMQILLLPLLRVNWSPLLKLKKLQKLARKSAGERPCS